jgi:hypothetical protein
VCVSGCYGSMFSEPFPSSSLLYWIRCFTLNVSCHSILGLKTKC